MKKLLKIGTRGSDLALAQTDIFRDALLQKYPHLITEVAVIHTQGDARLDAPLGAASPLDKGAFTKELETALLQKKIDVAIHSLKDLPTQVTPGLTLAAILPRGSTDDILITKYAKGLQGLPKNARIATGSARRRAYILSQRPDLIVENIRGNILTRIQKLAKTESLAAIVLAAAGLERLQLLGSKGLCKQLNLKTKVLENFLPAPGQGAIAVQTREADTEICNLLASVHHPNTAKCVQTERLLLEKLGGGCHLALGTLASETASGIYLEAIWWKDPQNYSSYCKTFAEGTSAKDTTEQVLLSF